MNKNYGVVTEQGFVAGEGLGFNPVSESEFKKNNNNNVDKSNKPETKNSDKK